MIKCVLILLLLVACETPILKAEFTNKVPAISIGNKYIYYNSWGLEEGVKRCDTAVVTNVEKECIHFCTQEKIYIMDKEKFEERMTPVEIKSP